MKDRTPKFPGRVKLKPVSGQTDTYDMTRADEPDDTGTPFNKRTMLQDSTGRFLRLPVSNPFVDDALRHMPDRIEPIGTVKTSPSLSLGDAWLPCDGSQVTFAEYPSLCQILRNTVGDVTWDGATVGTTPNFMGMSRVVEFKGKFYVAGCHYSKASGTLAFVYTLSIAVSDSAEGPYTVVYSETVTISGSGAYNDSFSRAGFVQMAVSDDLAVAVFNTQVNNPTDTFQVVTSTDGATWARKSATLPATTPGLTDDMPAMRGLTTDGTYWAFTTRLYVFYTDDPQNANTWSVKSVFTYPLRFVSRLNYVNGDWIAVCGSSAHDNKMVPLVYTAAMPGGEWTAVGTVGEKTGYQQVVTPVVPYSGRYWVSVSGGGLWQSSDLSSWTLVGTETNVFPSSFGAAILSATERLLALITSSGEVKTASDPNLGWNTVTLPAGSVPTELSADGDTLLAPGAGMIAYHDYSTDTRLLPTISLSDDTTTYIKAKNELDVFEAQESGGD